MLSLENVITHHNAATAIRYLLNFDINALNEKTIQLGIANIVDIEKTKKLCCTVFFTDSLSSEKKDNLVQQAMDLTRTLNDEAKQHLMEYLVTQNA